MENQVAGGACPSRDRRYSLVERAQQDVAPPRYFVHGWDTRDYYQSKLVTPPPAPGDPAYGVLWCWLKTPESYPNGFRWVHPQLGQFVPAPTTSGRQHKLGLYITELYRHPSERSLPIACTPGPTYTPSPSPTP